MEEDRHKWFLVLEETIKMRSNHITAEENLEDKEQTTVKKGQIEPSCLGNKRRNAYGLE